MINMRNSEIKTLLISINNVWRYGNIGMDQLAGYLREKGYSVDINYFKNKDNVSDVFNNLDLDYDVFGFYITNSNYQKSCELAKKIKIIKANATICFGSSYSTRYFREILEFTDDVDYIILGDGEKPTEHLLEKLLVSKKENRIIPINHSAIASKNDLIQKKEYQNKEISHFPAFDYYEKDDSIRNSRKVHCIQTKNNICTGNCSFCTERHGEVAYKDLDSIVEQIKLVYHKYGVKKFFFTDDNILDPNDDKAKENLYILCKKIEELHLGIAFQCYIKAISLSDTKRDHELLKLMKKIGFVEIFIGLEAGNQEDLDLYNKKTKLSDNYTIMKIIRENELIPIIGFISFNPYSDRKKITENFLFLCNVECTYLFNYIYSFVVINKYTKLYEMVKADNLLLSPEEDYTEVKYKYKNDDVKEVLDYVRFTMIPKLNLLDYQLDWVTYSYEEHKIWYEGIKDFTEELIRLKAEDLQVIKRYLSVLFVEYNLEKFRGVEEDFWQHFTDRQLRLKEIYDYLIGLHKNCKDKFIETSTY